MQGSERIEPVLTMTLEAQLSHSASPASIMLPEDTAWPTHCKKDT